jgi:hypothetical protein
MLNAGKAQGIEAEIPQDPHRARPDEGSEELKRIARSSCLTRGCAQIPMYRKITKSSISFYLHNLTTISRYLVRISARARGGQTVLYENGNDPYRRHDLHKLSEQN